MSQIVQEKSWFYGWEQVRALLEKQNSSTFS